jgi:hypothetical protein
MDDPHFDHRSAKRFDRQWALWRRRSVANTLTVCGKRQVLLNFVEWQRGQAARILADFELHVYEWTLTAVKFRQSLDKQDKRDVAQSIFAQDRDGWLAAHIDSHHEDHYDREGRGRSGNRRTSG